MSNVLEKARIYRGESIFFVLMGLFHLHRIWAFFNPKEYADFWLKALQEHNSMYVLTAFFLGSICAWGLIIFFKHINQIFWWRWIYLFGGIYVITDMVLALIGFEFWIKIIKVMFLITNPYWYIIWGLFTLLGVLSLILGIHLWRKVNCQKSF